MRKKNEISRAFAAASCAVMLVALAACGGGSEELDSIALRAEQIEARHLAKGASPSSKSRAAVPGVNATDAANQLFAFAEANLKNYFPSAQTTRQLNGWTYRYYPETGAYLAVIDWRVYVMGGPFGPEVIDAGELTKYVNVGQGAGASVLTASKLAQCPDAAGSSTKNYYTCMVGTLVGTQTFDKNKTCTFTVAADGELSLSSEGTRFALATNEQSQVMYSKAQASGTFDLSVVAGSGSFLSFDVDARRLDGLFFSAGGDFQVDAKQNINGNSLSCRFNVTP